MVQERGFGLGLNAWVGGELSGRGQGTHFGWGTKFVVTANFFGGGHFRGGD